MIDALFKNLTNNRWNISQTSAADRVLLLKKLKQEILKRREDIKLALYDDFKKPYAESELTEIHTVLDEINFAVKHLKCWMKPKKVRTPIALFGASSYIHHEARGVVLIMSPWNYPFSLMINPLVAAVAAGNCVLARPSEKTPHTGKILKEIIDEVFSPEHVSIVLGDVDVAEKLITLPFDHIFFTGSTIVGKKIAAAAAKNLATTTLELGGKSPVIIDSDVNLEDAVQKLAWGKFMNGGQTCVAPDYIFLPESLKESFIEKFKKQVSAFYGETKNDRLKSQDYARLIDQGSFERLTTKLVNEKNLLEGENDLEERYIPPTLIETHSESAIMQDEIFGPILPFLTYQNVDEVIKYIQSNPKPLALYIFSLSKSFQKNILMKTTSGGAVINNVVIHLGNPHLPFGGVGHSGIGSYHGHFGFTTFSHEKAVLFQCKFSLLHLFYPPFSGLKSKWAYKLIRLLE